MFCQKLKLCPPYYEILKKEGKDHSPWFQVSCTFEKNIEIGEGLSLKAAKECASAKIVEMIDIDRKLKDLDNDIVYGIESYNARLNDIWENDNETSSEYMLTLRKKNKKLKLWSIRISKLKFFALFRTHQIKKKHLPV